MRSWWIQSPSSMQKKSWACEALKGFCVGGFKLLMEDWNRGFAFEPAKVRWCDETD